MRMSFVRWIPVTALLAGLPVASALEEMSASAEGRGAITIQGQSLPVSRAEVSLIPGGRFIVSLTGEERYAFRGQWQDQGSRIALTIQEAQGAAAEGAGELRLRGDRFRTIQISGANRTFDANFTVTGAYRDFTAGATASDAIQAPQPPRSRGEAVDPVAPKAPAAPAAPTVRAPKVTVQGAGTLTSGRDERRTIDAMEVFLESDGRVHLKGFGPQGETTMTGTWKDGGAANGQQRFDLAISPGDGAPTAGRGYVLVGAGGRIDAVSVQGGSRVFRTSYNLTFRQR